MLELILGGAGSGKSTRLTQAIAADVAAGKRAWLIIPEQQANLSERTMLPKLPPSAGLTFTIAGFSRLAREVATQYGAAGAPIPAGLCSLIMWQNLRDLNGLLTEYQKASPRSDGKLTELLIATVDELRAGAVTPTMLERAAEQLPEGNTLRAKLYDLALLYAAYDHGISEVLDGKSGDEIAELATLLETHDYFAGGHVYIDSFTDFTAEEYAVLRHILRQADRVTLTLCSRGESGFDPAFDFTNETLRRITRLCEREHVEVRTEVLGDNHRAATDELALLERHLWNFALKKEDVPTPDVKDSITLLRCTNIYAEAEACALHILDCVQRGTDFGDVAVIVRNPDSYRGVLDAAFERHGIPYYFSEKTALSEMPLSRLLLSALRAVSHGWQAQDILTMLRTGLCPVSTYEIDLFEQYVTTWSINGAAFAADEWIRNPDGYTDRMSERGAEILRAANHVREVVMTPLLHLYSATVKGGKLPSLCAALYDLMQAYDVAGQCAALAERELAAGYLKEAGETVRAHDVISSTLVGIGARLPELSLDTEEFSTVLHMVFDATEIASVPSLHDSVTVGSAATLRVENVSTCFVLGLCEGEFPGAIQSAGLLTDAEKQQLAALGAPLDADRDLRSSSELFYVWRAMTKPSRHLYASTVKNDMDGKENAPSVAYNRLLYLFPYLKERVREFDLSMIAPHMSAPQADECCEPDDTEAEAAPAPVGYTPLVPSPHDPSPAIMSNYFGDTLWLTQSRIQSFVQCPYGFYCRYLLSLREKTVARIDYASSGTFLHYVLEHFLRGCLDGGGTFRLPQSDAVEGVADAIVNDYLRSMSTFAPTDLRTLHTFRRLRTLTLVLLRDILNELSHSKFRPTDFELKIGARAPDAPAPYEIALADGKRILLGGTVDRVDCYEKDGKIYLRVIDYKSGAKEFSTDDVRQGLNLQLLIYLFSLCRAENTLPAGILYVATANEGGRPVPNRTGLLVDDPELLAAMNDEWNPDYLAGVKMGKSDTLSGRALTSADELAALERDVCETLRRIGEDMLHGRAARTPSEDACRFCAMRDGCPDAVKQPDKKF